MLGTNKRSFAEGQVLMSHNKPLYDVDLFECGRVNSGNKGTRLYNNAFFALLTSIFLIDGLVRIILEKKNVEKTNKRFRLIFFLILLNV